MATLNAQTINRAGLAPSYSAASVGGDRFLPDLQTFLHVKNGGGSPVTVTVAATEKVQGLSLAAVADAVSAGGELMLGPFPAALFKGADGSGLADVTYSGVTTVTVAVLRLSA